MTAIDRSSIAKFEAFLNAFEEALGVNTLRPVETNIHVRYQPTQQKAEANEILIGLGAWTIDDELISHEGICLNNKDLGVLADVTMPYGSVTELVLDPPNVLVHLCRNLENESFVPKLFFKRYTLVVEDISPDSCLGLIIWLAQQNDVDSNIFLQGGALGDWTNAVRRWEATGMADAPFESWAALLSALSHSHIAPADLTSDHSTFDLTGAWLDALRFTVYLLKTGINPDAVPPLWDQPAYTRATAALTSERQDYELSLGQADLLQLLVPLAGTRDTRKLLVDAYFATETAPSGAKKLFIRRDCQNTYLKQGFAVMGLYRPDPKLRGSGDDIVISVNPASGIYLKVLWQRLEKLENQRWGGARPQKNPRALVSYDQNSSYDQPWWDDQGHYTLLGAPRSLPDGTAGSRLNWRDVLEAAWQCYNPLGNLHVKDRLASNIPTLLHACFRQPLKFDNSKIAGEKRLVAVAWMENGGQTQSLFSCPTAQRVFAGIVSRNEQGAPLRLNELPESATFDVVSVHGGFAMVHEYGALLFDDWCDSSLRFDRLRQEFDNAVSLLSKIIPINRELDCLLTFQKSERQRSAHGIITRVAELRASLAQAKLHHAPKSHHDDVRRFRDALDQRWNISRTVDETYRRASEIEETQRTLTALQTRDLMAWLSTYGLPFFVSGTIVSNLNQWLDSPRWWKSLEWLNPNLNKAILEFCNATSDGAILDALWKSCGFLATTKVVVYLLLSLTLILLLNWIQKRRTRKFRINSNNTQ